MSGLARRYWASLTDTDGESLELLIEHGRQRDATLWRRYLASLLDMPVAFEAVVEAKQAKGVAPTSAVFYDIETTVDIEATLPPRRSWWRGASFALVALLVVSLAFGVSRVLLPAPRPVPPATSIGGDTYQKVKDPAGYSIDIPWGWNRTEIPASTESTGEKLRPVVRYDDSFDGRQLLIFEVAEATPAESLDLAENVPKYGFAALPDYQVVQRDQGDTWVELSYRYDDMDKGPRQVIDHRFETTDGTLYAIRSSGGARLDPDQVREPLNMAVNSFCLTGAHCS